MPVRPARGNARKLKSSHPDVNHVLHDFQSFMSSQDFQESQGCDDSVASLLRIASDSPKTKSEESPEPTEEEWLLECIQKPLSLATLLCRLFTKHDSCIIYTEDNWSSVSLFVTRWLRSHPKLIDLGPDEAWKAIAAIVNDWQSEKVKDWWGTFFHVSEEDAEVAIKGWWSKVASTPSSDPVEFAYLLADQRPIKFQPETLESRSSKYPVFLSFCYFLQRGRPKQEIFLPVEKLSALFKVTPKTISRYREWAVEDGHLKMVRASQPGSATEFTCDLGLISGKDFKSAAKRQKSK